VLTQSSGLILCDLSGSFQANPLLQLPDPLALSYEEEDNFPEAMEVLFPCLRGQDDDGLVASSEDSTPANFSDKFEIDIPRDTLETAILEDEESRNLGHVADCHQLSLPPASGPPVPNLCDMPVKRVTRKERRRKKTGRKRGRRKRKLRKKGSGGKQGNGRALLYRRFRERKRRQRQRVRAEKKMRSTEKAGTGKQKKVPPGLRRRLGRAKLRRFWLQSEKYQAWRREQSRQQLLEQPGAQLAIQQLWQGLFRQGDQWQQVYQVINNLQFSSSFHQYNRSISQGTAGHPALVGNL